jgi:hypothetical protein
LLHSEVALMPIGTKIRDIKNPIKGTFKAPTLPIERSMTSAISMIIQIRMLSSNTAIGEIPNQRFNSALDVNTIERHIKSMDPKNGPILCELSDMAKETIALSIGELDACKCKTFSSIDELFEDLESD